ncbi:type II toxin-antitoxin system PemK/MazF family toxin [Aeromonas veronii]|nr:type II toxin-antitoxin system PemK/MazF family toxin [Aeromonas veronii]
MKVFEQGDIISVTNSPFIGANANDSDKKICVVLSPKAFNRLGLTLVAPIVPKNSCVRFEGFAVPIKVGHSQSEIMANDIFSLNLGAKICEKIGVAPPATLSNVTAIIGAIIGIS